MQTRRYPRTLTEAFGPYTSRDIVEKQDPRPVSDKIVITVCLCAAVTLVLFAVWGWV